MTSPNFSGQMIFGYDSEGVLKYYQNDADLEVSHMVWLGNNFPFHVDDLPRIVMKGSIKEITDLTFEYFWKEYNNKVGNRAQAEKLWRKLNDSDKIAVFDHLPKYRYYLNTHQGIMQAYATTFLNQRRWENIYK